MDGQQDHNGQPLPDPFAAPPTPAPPTPAPAAPAPFEHSPVSVVLPEERPKRRTGLLVGVSALVLAAVGAGAFLLLRDGDDADDDYSLQAATANAAEMEEVAYQMTIDAMGEQIDITAEVDVAENLARMTMDMGSLVEGIEVIVDIDGEVAYLSSEMFESLGLEVETEWIAMDKEFMEQTGDDTIFTSATANDALQASELLDNAKSVTDLGLETVDGEELRHYEVVVSAADATAANPQIQQQFDDMGVDMPEDLTYDMWVTKDNILRRIKVDLDMGQAIVSTEITIRALDAPLDIELPDPDDVTQASDLL
jgi:hypothetical protein